MGALLDDSELGPEDSPRHPPGTANPSDRAGAPERGAAPQPGLNWRSHATSYFNLYDLAPVGYLNLDEHGIIRRAQPHRCEYARPTPAMNWSTEP